MTWKLTMVLLGIAVLLLWLLAIASMRAGNPTAVNAVVGIPLGCVFGVPMVIAAWRLDRDDRKDWKP